MAIDSQSLYVQLGRLAETVPKAAERRGASGLQWFGRAHALVAAFDRSEGEQLQSAIDNMISFESSEYAAKAMFIFYRVLAAAELQAPAAVQGSFIPAGNAFDALAVLSKVLSSATIECLIVDPYMDEKTLTDFAPLAHEGVSIRLLADEASYKPTLKPAAQRWISQYGKIRPMKAKIAPPRTLHDRLITTDKNEVWLLTQSLNAFAARSPATIVRIDPETAGLKKMAAYDAIWNLANPL